MSYEVILNKASPFSSFLICAPTITKHKYGTFFYLYKQRLFYKIKIVGLATANQRSKLLFIERRTQEVYTPTL